MAFRPPNTRRVVTGHNGSGKSTVILDYEKEGTISRNGPILNPMWNSHEFPADISKPEDKGQESTAGSLVGSFFTTYDIPPHSRGLAHRSVTLDYATVLRGSIVLDLDDTKVTLHEGDTVVQQGTMHNWHNESDDWARMATVMLPAEPVRINGEVLGPCWPY